MKSVLITEDDPLLWTLLNKMGKSDIMRGYLSILSLFGNKFNITFNSKGARMQDSIFLAHWIRISEILP